MEYGGRASLAAVVAAFLPAALSAEAHGRHHSFPTYSATRVSTARMARLPKRPIVTDEVRVRARIRRLEGGSQLPQPLPGDSRAPAEPSLCETSLVAFPGAEGFGAKAVGGRGGKVIEVTNLNDSGPGSLRAALTASGPRVVVFRVGGTIETKTMIEVSNPYVTIAGQTAPGGGIALKASSSYEQGSLKIMTHDVIIRGLRLRPGASTATSVSRRGLLITAGSHDVIVDHSSISWATDSNMLIIKGAHDISVQWSITSEALSNSTHAEGEHSKGLDISGKYSSTDKTRDVSIHHNLFAHNYRRNPLNASFGLVDLVNNVIYNYGKRAVSVSDRQAAPSLNFISNYVKPGPDSIAGTYELNSDEIGTGFGSRLYVAGNIGPNRALETQPEFDVVRPSDRLYLVQTRFPAPVVSTTSALQAYQQVLAEAGATVPQRDAVDNRVVAEVRGGVGHIVDDPREVGGWPQLPGGTPPADNDRDGMPNAWEEAHGFDPAVDDGALDKDGDGYANVEEYVNGLFPDPCSLS
jgi:pectate lyase